MDDYNARRLEREEGKAEGEAIGLAKGEKNATKGIALNMISMNLSDEQIHQATGLSFEEIKKLKK